MHMDICSNVRLLFFPCLLCNCSFMSLVLFLLAVCLANLCIASVCTLLNTFYMSKISPFVLNCLKQRFQINEKQFLGLGVFGLLQGMVQLNKDTKKEKKYRRWRKHAQPLYYHKNKRIYTARFRIAWQRLHTHVRRSANSAAIRTVHDDLVRRV